MTIMTQTITHDQITQLQTEAGSAGDSAMWQICEDAMAGGLVAQEVCQDVIAEAAAQIDD